MARSILVYGGGAIGSTIGWRLAQNSAHEVSVVCRSNFQVVNANGYCFRTTTWGKGDFRPRRVFQAGHLTGRPPRQDYDYIVCANKVTGSFEPMLDDMHAMVTSETTLVTAQNGMDVEAPLRKNFPENTILAMICNIGCRQVNPGFVEQVACIKPHPFTVGIQQNGGHGLEKDRRSLATLAAMSPDFEAVDSIEKVKWRKLIFNCAWNSTTALSGLDTHSLIKVPGATEVVFQLAEEANKVAIASGIDLGTNIPRDIVEMAKVGPPITPSTLQDARKRQPLELEPIFGFLVRQAAKLNVHAPRLTLTYSLLQQMNDGFERRKPEPALLLTRNTFLLSLGGDESTFGASYRFGMREAASVVQV